MNDYDAMFQADIDSTFLRDFGKEHRIGSRNVRCVIDTNVGIPNPGLMSEPYYGLSTNKLRIFVKKGDIPTPEVNQNFTVLPLSLMRSGCSLSRARKTMNEPKFVRKR